MENQNRSRFLNRQGWRRLATVLGLAVLGAGRLAGQDTRMHGSVRDERGQPMENIEIVIHQERGGQRLLRSQRDGSFSTTLRSGSATVTARSPGFLSVDTVLLARDGTDIEFNPVLVRLTELDAVVTTALPPACSDPTTIAGFNCRRLNANGIFFDRLQVQKMKALYLADVFWDIPGLVVEPTRRGPRVTNQYGWGCIVYLANGRPVLGPLPESNDLLAVEVYMKYSDVPAPYKTFSWSPPGPVKPQLPCVLINLWTGH